MKLIVTTTGDGYEGSGVETSLQDDNGKVLHSVEFRDGESEDMYIARDLNDAKFIWKLVEAAHQAGKRGEDLVIEHVKESDEE